MEHLFTVDNLAFTRDEDFWLLMWKDIQERLSKKASL